MVQIVWFKRDLRTTDHRPLHEAAATGPLIPLYMVEPGYWASPDTARRQYIATAAALAELGTRLAELGAPLILRVGEAVGVLRALHRRHGITRILAHEETGNAFTHARDRAVRRFAREAGIAFVEYPHFAVIRGLTDRDRWGAAHAAFLAAPRWPEPAALNPLAGLRSEALPQPEALGLTADGCAAPQPGTRALGLDLLRSFLGGRGAAYRWAMARPEAGAQACSRLSVPLATGALSIREVHQYLLRARAALLRRDPQNRPVPLGAVDSLIARLHWHCHFIQKLEREPALEWRAAHPLHEAARRRTAPDDPWLNAWAEGRTGFPFVDACMRALIATGWLNFRMRAMLMAFASYHLGLDWQASGTRLARLFTDYEPGIHWPQVQMQAGQTGINTPRLYNPVKQGFDQDPQGDFVRRFVPELAGLAGPFVHEPWRLDAAVLGAAGVTLGITYPQRLVDPAAALRAARARLSLLRHQPGYAEASREVYRRHASRSRPPGNDHPAASRAQRREVRQGRFDL